MLAFYVVMRLPEQAGLFSGGAFLVVCVGVPLCHFCCDQMMGHVVYWISADPRVDREAMILIRNAWFGRFMTQRLAALAKCGVSAQTHRRFQFYGVTHVLVGAAFLGGMVVGLMLAIHLLKVPRPGATMITCSSLCLVVTAMWTRACTLSSRHSFSMTLGHWFLYQKGLADAVVGHAVPCRNAASSVSSDLPGDNRVGVWNVVTWSRGRELEGTNSV